MDERLERLQKELRKQKTVGGETTELDKCFKSLEMTPEEQAEEQERVHELRVQLNEPQERYWATKAENKKLRDLLRAIGESLRHTKFVAPWILVARARIDAALQSENTASESPVEPVDERSPEIGS